MIFADKLIQLRKKAGWSQEELAEQMQVSRQSVSKWEGAQSIPDLEKIIRLSVLFGVSTDYLLKDEMEIEEYQIGCDETSALRRVSMEEAHAFLAVKAAAAKPTAYAVLLCILSPICLISLTIRSKTAVYGLFEQASVAIGMITLLVFVAAAVAIFLVNGSKSARYSYLESEAFETEYGVVGMVRECMERYKSTYTRHNIIGVCLCILSAIPLYIGVMLSGDDGVAQAVSISALLILVGIGVTLFVRSGVIWESYQKLLQEGDYTKENKEKQPLMNAVSVIYWLCMTAIFLAYSFVTNNWDYSWIIWPVAGVLFPALLVVVDALAKRK